MTVALPLIAFMTYSIFHTTAHDYPPEGQGSSISMRMCTRKYAWYAGNYRNHISVMHTRTHVHINVRVHVL